MRQAPPSTQRSVNRGLLLPLPQRLTCSGTQIVSQYSSILAPIAVSAVTRLVTPTSVNVDLRDVRVVKKVGGTIEDTELIEGVVLNQNVVIAAGGPTRIEKAKIAIIQFQLSAPKPDVGLFPLLHLAIS